MIVIDAKSGIKGKLFNVDTGEEIKYARKIALSENPNEPGEFEALQQLPNGQWLRDQNGRLILRRGRCRLRFEPDAIQQPTIQQTNKQEAKQPTLRPRTPRWEPLPEHWPENCQHYGCINRAVWQVSDEVEIEPVVHGGKAFGQATLVGMRFYCDRHYKGPRIYDSRGELVQQIEDIKARPE